MPSPVTTGTVAVTNGSATATGALTNWLTTVRAGDELQIAAPLRYVIASVDSDTQITLHDAYAGSTASGSAYKIFRKGELARDFLSARERLDDLAVQFENGVVFRPDAIGTFNDRALYDDEWLNNDGKPFIFAATTDPDGTPRATWRFYAKKTASSADWSLGSIPEGEQGSTGPAGFTPGRLYMWSVSTVDSDPGSGSMRANNATFASITKLWIDDTDGEGAAASGWLDTFDDSTNTGVKGTLWLFKESDRATFRIFNVTGSVVDKTGYRELTVTPVTGGSNGTLSDTDEVVLFFVYAGNVGAAGANGTNGTNGTDGADGFQTGYRFEYDSGTGNDPATGTFRFDNATFIDIAAVYFSTTDGDGGAVGTWLDSLDDSTTVNHKGYLRFEKIGAPDVYREFVVTGAVSALVNGRSVPVSDVATAGTWTDGDDFAVTFRRTGDQGITEGVATVNGVAPDSGGNVDILTTGFRVDVTNTPSIPNATETAITFNTETLDDFDLITVSTSQVVFAEAGTWLFAGYAQGTSMSVTYVRIGIYNASDVLQASFLMPSNTSYTGVFGAGPVAVEAGWKVRLMLRHDSGGARNLIANTTFLQGYKIA